MSLADHVVIIGNRALARSYAKINLTLDVIGKLDNGYHEIEMIMQTINLFDLIIIDKAECGIKISTNLKYLPNNEKNIAYKAAAAFFEYTKIHSGVKIMIQKNIPVSAGLAGGSGNAAAVLVCLDKLFGTYLSYEELQNLASGLGADVPYCILGGTQLAKGIGQDLTVLSHCVKTNILLVKPYINVSTAEIYNEIDSSPIEKRPNTARMISAIEKGDIITIADSLCNVMENVTEKRYPIIRGIKEKMILNGALGAVMSGSGPTVFGIFEDEKIAKKAADSFSMQFKEVFLTKTLK